MPPPDHLGRLARVRRVGSGAFATVWLYRDPDLDSDVAVKVLDGRWAADPAIRDRFLAESRLLRRVSSAHVVTVYDIGVVEDAPYFVMAYADGGTVADLLRPGGCSPAELLDVVGQAAEGLAALHARGIVHRDVKPANLLLSEGRVVVGDLGVAKQQAGIDALQVVGTPAYMAPEQEVEGAVVDHRADVRALGAVAYALLTGRAPARPPRPLGELRAVPSSVAAAVTRALDPDPERRQPDVRALVQELRPEPPEPPPPPRAPRSRRWIAVALVALLVAALALAGYLALREGGTDPFEDAAVDYVEKLQADDCEGASLYSPDPVTPAEMCASLHRRLADNIDLDGPRRVEMIGEARARVVFIDQGYLEIYRDESTLFRAGYFVASSDPD